MKKLMIFCVVMSSINGDIFCAGAAQAHDCCACQLAMQSNMICYVGSLDLDLKGVQGRDFTVLYKGVSLKVHDGVYCFKEPEVASSLYMLFVDVKSIQYASEDNTVSSLMLPKDAAYSCYALTRAEHPSSGADVLVDWAMMPVTLPLIAVKGTSYAQIPLHTIVVPLSPRFFEQSTHGDIIFDNQESKDNEQIIRLPLPRVVAKNRDELLKAVIEADLELLNLKNIHACQEQSQICMDKHSLVQ